MTDEEKWALLMHRLNTIEKSIGELEDVCDEMKDANKDLWKLLGKVRADEELLRTMSINIDAIVKSVDKLWERTDNIKNIVMPKHEAWNEAVDNQKKFMLWVVGIFLAGVSSVVGMKVV